MERSIRITLNTPFLLVFNRPKVVSFNIEEIIPDLPYGIPANDQKLEELVSRIAREGILDKSEPHQLRWIAPSQIRLIELQFDSLTINR